MTPVDRLVVKISAGKQYKNRFLILLLAVFTALVVIGAAPFRYPEPGLDPSWQQALVEATDSGRVFGRDIVFTYGPLHQAVTDQVSRDMTPFVLSRILFSMTWFFSVLIIGNLAGVWAAFSIALAAALASGSFAGPQGDLPFYLFSLVSIISSYSLWLNRPSRTGSFAMVVLPILLASGALWATLVKLSYLGAAIPSLFAIYGIQFLDLFEKKSLRSVLLFLLALAVPFGALCLVWAALSGWSMGDFVGYYSSLNLEIIKGYADAMSYGPSRSSLALVALYWASILLTFRVYFKLSVDNRLSSGSSSVLSGPHCLLILVAVLLLSWVVFKSAFVRDDGAHVVLGALFLVSFSLVVIGFNADRLTESLRVHGVGHLFLVLAPPLALSSLLALLAGYRLPVGIVSSLSDGLKDGLSLFVPRERDRLASVRERALAGVRPWVEDYGIREGGSADIIPWDITSLLANRLVYKPRPVPQSYSVYTQPLQKANSDFLLNSPDVGDYLIVDAKDIDGRLPVGLDSPLLLSLKERYVFSHRGSQGSLVFRRRDVPKIGAVKGSRVSCDPVVAGELVWTKGGGHSWYSQVIPFPERASGAVVLAANLRDSLSRSLISGLYRPFPVFIEYLDRNGMVLGGYRFVAKAGYGMIVYPVVRSNDELFSVLTQSVHSSSAPSSRVRSMRLSTQSLGRPFYTSRFRLTEGCVKS
ncbi:hypothetical protein [Vulcanococcus limneticus]|uniref:hypothetical protein n=1 Tax=Vulcanococcus limneticus TaxID=2170428 RepID=UPI00398BBF0C